MPSEENRPKGFHLHHVAVQTRDLPKAVRFYRDILGLTPIKEEKSAKGREIVWFEAGGARIELYGGKPGQELAEGWRQDGVGPLSIGFWVDRLDEAVSALRSKGVKIHREPYYPVPNERAAMILGPDGEEIVLLEQRVE